MHGKVVIITGAASGIGAAAAALLAKEGARLVLADIDIKKLNEQVDTLRTRHDNIIAAPLDVRKKSSWESVLNIAIDTFRMVDVVVNCAACRINAAAERSCILRNEIRPEGILPRA